MCLGDKFKLKRRSSQDSLDFAEVNTIVAHWRYMILGCTETTEKD